MKIFNVLWAAGWILLCAASFGLPQSFAIDAVPRELNAIEPHPGGGIGHFQWKDMGEGITYQFQMARDREFRDLVLDRRCEKPEITFPQPAGPGTYYVRVRPVGSDGHEYRFHPAQNYVIDAPLEPPAIIAPGEISEVRDVFDVDVAWSGVPGAAGYHLLIARDRRFRNVILDRSGIVGTSLRVRNLDFGTHFIKIKTISEDGVEGSASDVRAFIVVPHPTTAPYAW